MFERIRRRRRGPQISDEVRNQMAPWAYQSGPACPEDQQIQPQIEFVAEPDVAVDDFIPPDLRIPSHDQVDGYMTAWPHPLVLDDDVVACTTCGAYRNWLILSTRGQIWLRCRAGHQQQEERLDTAWYNRNTGPAGPRHDTFEECLRDLEP